MKFAADEKHTSINAGNSNTLATDLSPDYTEDQDEEYYDSFDDEQQKQNQHLQHHLQNQQQQKQHHQQQQNQQQQQQQRHYTSFSSSSVPSQGFRHYQRIRRDVNDPSQSELQSKLKCNRTECAHVRCVVSNLEKDSSAWIALRMRLVTQTLNSVSNG